MNLLTALSVLLSFVAGVALTLVITAFFTSPQFISPLSTLQPTIEPRDLSSLSIPSLASYSARLSEIIMQEHISSTPDFERSLVSFTSDGKRLSAVLTYPTTATPSAGFPLILMLRGFVSPDRYTSGIGTNPVSGQLAAAGFATLAPDFAGFGTSDPPDSNVFAARFEKSLHLLDLLASLSTIPSIDSSQIGLWGHSNGGQQALSLLAITGRDIPTVLWAPVTAPFPYSILYYTYDYTDEGQALRQSLASFEAKHDPRLFGFTHFTQRIVAPLSIHLGLQDPDIPRAWVDDLVSELRDNSTAPLEYQLYPQADHNLKPNWTEAVNSTIRFYQTHLLSKTDTIQL